MVSESTLDRALQKRILQKLRADYPRHLDASELGVEQPSLSLTLFYLAEHELVRVIWYETPIGNFPRPEMAVITAKGLDFLADDGGLSAILGTITVKLHEDTLRAILEDAVEKSAEPPGVKKKLLEQIKSLPAEVTKQAVLDAAKAGLQQAPVLAAMLQKWLGG